MPFVSASSTVAGRELLLLSIEDGDGNAGFGEAAPLASYDGVGMPDCRDALEDCRPILAAGDGVPRAELLARCADAAVLPQAIAAIDLALWDLEGQRAGRPVWHLLGAAEPPAVTVNATIAAPDRASAAAQAAAARDAGFRTVKVKVGLGDDAGRIAAVRAAAGRELAIRLDANGAWEIEEALATLRVLAPAGVELCEEPVSGLDAMAAVWAESPMPVALDESARLPGALEHRVADAACLKISGCGGISGVIAAAAQARAAGYEVYLASTLDGPLGIAAALHAAAVLAPVRACGLATLSAFERADPLPPRDGAIAVPAGPGLGDGLVDWYR